MRDQIFELQRDATKRATELAREKPFPQVKNQSKKAQKVKKSISVNKLL